MESAHELQLELAKLRIQTWRESAIRRTLVVLASAIGIFIAGVSIYLAAVVVLRTPAEGASLCTTSTSISSTYAPDAEDVTKSEAVPTTSSTKTNCTPTGLPPWIGFVGGGIIIALLIPEILSWGGRLSVKIPTPNGEVHVETSSQEPDPSVLGAQETLDKTKEKFKKLKSKKKS